MDEISATTDAATLQRIVLRDFDWSGPSTTEVVEDTSGHGEDHAGVLENFAGAIIFGEPLMTPASEGMNSVRLSNATLLSGWLGREVPFDFDEDLFLAELNARIRAEGLRAERS